jgi:hypothetical protein
MNLPSARDAHRSATADELIQRIREDERLLGDARGRELSVAAVRLLIDVGELAQGLLDRELGPGGVEPLSPLGLFVLQLLRAAASIIVKGRPSSEFSTLIAELERKRLPHALSIVEPEAFTTHAVYPELYARVASQVRRDEPITVVGIRTVGASLGAVVAEAIGARDFVTVRPAGNAAEPELRTSEPFTRFVAKPDRVYAIVDDGPKPSGAGFGAVGDWLEARKVPRRNVLLFPNHTGPLGADTTERHRAFWNECQRFAAPLDLASASRLVSPTLRPPALDISGGVWRKIAFAHEDEYPPVVPERERRKVLVRRAGKRWLYKFAGLGRYGEAKLERCRALARHGLVPEPKELQHGFLRMEWIEGTRAWPLQATGQGSPARHALLDGVTRYIEALGASFPAPPTRRGASIAELFAMASHNARELLGDGSHEELRQLKESAGDLDVLVHPRFTDNKMQGWEWLLARDGRVLKCDALDHATDRGLVGPQDLAWDVAGAFVELRLTPLELGQLVERVSRVRDQHALSRKLSTYLVLYLAFRGGELDLAARTAEAQDRSRLIDERSRVTGLLRRCLAAGASTLLFA